MAGSYSDMEFLRQLGIVDPEKLAAVEVTVIGAGGIGSPTVLALAKMGVMNIRVYDNDTVERHNLPNQWYRIKDLGKAKVKALREIVEEYTGVQIDACNELFTNQPVSGIVISAVDSMDVRLAIWEQIKLNPSVDLYIDGRMGGQQYYTYAVSPCDPDHIEWYEARLYPSSTAAELPCSARSIIFTLLAQAAHISLMVKQFVNQEDILREVIHDLPTGVLETRCTL
ncbi:hypothetical protein A3C09_03960 [Candidatus Uhrbacteria bacterium RIFCSPHIGHO2_02_FULL_47_44]|uniref:THIF-type NAD/FAD binding fold domain-containing protein n=1 Tax=Candidatus Uhrbacteria bacterium RIFCSPLOWO2_02_FULL_48_18 TaxID=1802408 RepID=A0A1F7VE17_9BACT|nr:MAG: hypothetical protein A2839_01965 [Candidatus Uhrbacteria bacterium RIFCSPHIGHO2_01_FULL_47_10]OGL71833.1 MAG: hypothetical protein A3C09_03960 [Candidatus Uhrbacteria bacterium RIFCSPHIGHO2_02_FULL_47_44]OGL77058.1 MAG: hypothetical protein A3E97_01505 [Candidatus Uhrbacteria bacterium RIFCSPHIGHO2_12_FULL_47_12]OGL80593.1 MAG: hypothetical protein A3B20_04325 [Candidatus Uhrbacteria bacterium RIFCSPLOWO2_01_FULL_47_17]OGL88224.1 MAG: hypothetical protein A3I41_00655 [Candidatus Uhrbact